jgi:hypothetical protein
VPEVRGEAAKRALADLLATPYEEGEDEPGFPVFAAVEALITALGSRHSEQATTSK